VDAYPFELSGGLRQRAMIAMALVSRPALVIADEPTSALDVTVQAQILDLLVRLQREHGMGLIIITHDPGVVAHVADFVTVMYCGHVMETGPVGELFERPEHPYLQALLRSTPQFGVAEGERLQTIAGAVPDPLAPIPGCPFLSRCPEGEPGLCGDAMPAPYTLSAHRYVACYKRGSMPEISTAPVGA
jgi:peptide/nickel transport system ATP-binding protein